MCGEENGAHGGRGVPHGLGRSLRVSGAGRGQLYIIYTLSRLFYSVAVKNNLGALSVESFRVLAPEISHETLLLSVVG